MSIQEAESLYDQFIARRAIGVFFVPFEHRTNCEAANERITTKLHKAGMPVVLIDRDVRPFPERWYLANPVRFQQSLKVEIQNQHTDGKPTTTDADDYTSVAFWYQEEPHQALGLPGFKERTATSNTSEK